MLRRIGEDKNRVTGLPISEAAYPAPFHAGLEYSSPARGCWNIVHTGMLIPQSHQIFVCAYGCLRGVVLTAAEMNALDRYSSICIREENVLDGGMEDLMIEGVTDIIGKLTFKPRAIMIFISCQHFFLAYDQEFVFEQLRMRFPEIKFTDCYMIPTLRKSGLTPDQKMRMQMYSFWEKCESKNLKKINFIGSNLKIYEQSELVTWLTDEGFELWDLYKCKTFDEYMQMADAHLNLLYEPIALKGAEELKDRLDMDYQYLSFTFDYEELDEEYRKLAKKLGISSISADKTEQLRRETDIALESLKSQIGETELVLDYTLTFRILSLAKLLLDHGFHVTRVYLDACSPDDANVFETLQKEYPDLMILPTNQPEMRFALEDKEQNSDRKVLALGQKAAYFEGSDYFVNVAESGGLFGYRGIQELVRLMAEAYAEKKDRKELIQKKGFGCESCV